MSSETVGDKELMAKLGVGDVAALGELARRHQDRILSLAYRFLGRWDLAEDIGQETFLRAWKAARHYTPKAKFTTWLSSIAINLCVDEQRRLMRAARPWERLEVDSQVEWDCNGAEKQELVGIVRTAIMELSERQRLAVILHRYDGLSHSEISDVTGWSKSAVESLLVRAYANLRNKLDKIKDFAE
jgi:RNA polymerase sigma-70 factor (ECF subfamily)